MPPMNTPNVPEISIAPPTTVSSHDSRTSNATTSDIHIIHDADEMYHHPHHGDDRALSSPTSSPPTSSSFRPPNATESIFRDLPQSPGHRPQDGNGGTKSGNMIVIHDDEHKEVLTKMPPRKRRPPTPYPPSAADTSEPAPTATADSPSCVEDSHRTRHAYELDDNDDNDHSDDDHGDHDDDDGDDDDDDDPLSSPTRPDLERRVAVYPILPYMKMNPPHTSSSSLSIHDNSNNNDSRKLKGTGESRTKHPRQQHDHDHSNDDNNNIGSKEEGRLGEIDTTMDVDDSYDAEYHHQYPVVSAYQSSHDLFKLPATSATSTTQPQTHSTATSPPLEHDERASVSSLVRGGTSTDLYHESLNDRSSKDEAVAKWAQDQARIHQRRLQKRKARAEALQELRKAHAAAVVTTAKAGPAGEAHETSVSDGLSPLRLRREMQDASGTTQGDQESQAQATTPATITAAATTTTTTAAAPLKVLLEDNDTHHEKADGEEDVQALKVQQQQGPLEPIDRTETTGAGVGKPY
ncbi:hypothetical protein BGZ72_004619 [Mortierella alpina]|nr:hypothetical protein BGZ72_004619 [Mortierella alpina]